MRKLFSLAFAFLFSLSITAQQTQKPPLHGKQWMAITGKPLAATAGSMVFQKGGYNAQQIEWFKAGGALNCNQIRICKRIIFI